jgi:hypothetical protein
MAELKTKKTETSVDEFLAAFPEETRKDCLEIAKLMAAATRSEAKMWGSSIIGFGSVRLKYPNGRELDWMKIGFSPRKQNLTLYLGGLEQKTVLLKKLGKHTTGKGCLYIKRLEDVDKKVLKELIGASVKAAKVKG